MRRTVLLIGLLFSSLALLPALTRASAEPPPTLDRDAATQLLTMVNAERVARGLVPLVDDPALRGWAEKWSLHMGTTGVLAHNDALFTRAAHQSLGIKVFAENVAWDDATFGVVGAHKQFIGSADHYENMLGPAYRLAGFAVARDSKGRVWVTEDFGTPRIATAPVVRVVAPTPVPPRAVARPRVVSGPAPRRARVVATRNRAPAAAVVPAAAAAVRFASVREAVERTATTGPISRLRALSITSAGARPSPPGRPTPLLFVPLLVLATTGLAALRVARTPA